MTVSARAPAGAVSFWGLSLVVWIGLHVFNVARLFRLTREGCLHAKPSLKITNHGRRKVLIHVRIYEHRAAAGRTSNLKRLVRLPSDRMIAYLKFFRISPADAVALSLALRALTLERPFLESPRILCTSQLVPAFGLRDPSSSILRISLGPL